MKRTTYILIGMLVSGLIVIMAGVYYGSVQSARNRELTEFVWGDTVSMDVAGIHTIEFRTADLTETPPLGELFVKPVGQGQKGKFTYSRNVAPFFDIKRIKDTLVVSFRVTDELLKLAKRNDLVPHGNLRFVLEVDSAFVAIDSKSVGMDIRLSNLELDTLGLQTRSYQVFVDSCRIGSLNATAVKECFNVKQSCIRDLYLDLDYVHSLNINDSQINTEHLFGSGRHYINRNDSYDKLIWTPKNEDAEININLKGKSYTVTRE